MLLLFAACHFKISNGLWFQDLPLFAWNDFVCVCVGACVFSMPFCFIIAHITDSKSGTNKNEIRDYRKHKHFY